jgi:hypothetical protein
MVAKNQTFRLDNLTLDVLEKLASATGISRTEVVRRGVHTLGGLLMEASRESHDSLTALRERFGDDAEMVVAVFADDDGRPQGGVKINGETPEDVRVVPVVIVGSSEAHLFLDFGSEPDALWRRDGEPFVALAGDEVLLIPYRHALLSIGKLPWPPQSVGLVFPLGDLSRDTRTDEIGAKRLETVGA